MDTPAQTGLWANVRARVDGVQGSTVARCEDGDGVTDGWHGQGQGTKSEGERQRGFLATKVTWGRKERRTAARASDWS